MSEQSGEKFFAWCFSCGKNSLRLSCARLRVKNFGFWVGRPKMGQKGFFDGEVVPIPNFAWGLILQLQKHFILLFMLNILLVSLLLAMPKTFGWLSWACDCSKLHAHGIKWKLFISFNFHQIFMGQSLMPFEYKKLNYFKIHKWGSKRELHSRFCHKKTL